MKSFQDRLFKDFDVEKVPEKNGKIRNRYVYVGDYAAWCLNEEEKIRYKRLYAGCGILIIVLYIWKSLMPLPVNSARFAGASTLLSLAALMPLIGGLWKFIFARKEMYLRDAREARSWILWGSMLYLILQIAGVIAGIVFSVMHGAGFWEAVVILAGAVSAFLAFVLYAAQLRLRYLEIPNPGKKKDGENGLEAAP